MPHIDTRNAYHNAPPQPEHQPTSHRPQHTQWNPHNLVNNAMSNPFREYHMSYPYFPTIPSSYYAAHPVMLTTHEQSWVSSCSLRPSLCFSVVGACGIGSAAWLARQSRPQTYLVCTSTYMNSLRQMTTSPSQTRPCPQCFPPSAHSHRRLRECSSSSHRSFTYVHR